MKKTINYELAKKLCEICYVRNIPMPPSSHQFLWHRYNDEDARVYLLPTETGENPKVPENVFFPAYTVDELLNWLPNTLFNNQYTKALIFSPNEKMWVAQYSSIDLGLEPLHGESSKEMCFAVGKLAVWCIESEFMI